MTGTSCSVTLPFAAKWNKRALFKAYIVSDTYDVNGKIYVAKFTCREHTEAIFILINIWETA